MTGLTQVSDSKPERVLCKPADVVEFVCKGLGDRVEEYQPCLSLGIYYKGLYYSVTQDADVAINDGYTDVIIGITFDRDTIAAIPINVSFRQVGLFDTVNATSNEIQYGISADAWRNKSTTDKGMLVAVENRAPVTRQDDQTEQVILLISF